MTTKSSKQESTHNQRRVGATDQTQKQRRVGTTDQTHKQRRVGATDQTQVAIGQEDSLSQPAGLRPQAQRTVACSLRQGVLHLGGINTFCDAIQQQFSLLIDQPCLPEHSLADNSHNWDLIEKLEIFQAIQHTVQKVRVYATQRGLHPGEMAAPSLRAWQWLVFLSQPANLAAHLAALVRLKEIANKPAFSKHRLASQAPIYTGLSFFHIPNLLRSRPGQPAVKMVVSEGFIHAPDDILESLLQLGVNAADKSALTRVRKYAKTPEFKRTNTELAKIDDLVEQNALGQHQNLLEIFGRVKNQYFDPSFTQPRLTWNKTLTYNKYGHYIPASDTVMISMSLDAPDTPDYVLDFVMYHELLHKAFGFRGNQSRLYAHHKAFRQKEKQFPHYEQAQAYLSQLGSRVRRKKKKSSSKLQVVTKLSFKRLKNKLSTKKKG